MYKYFLIFVVLSFLACDKEESIIKDFTLKSVTIDNNPQLAPRDISLQPKIKIQFSNPVSASSILPGIRINGYSGEYDVSVEDSTVILNPKEKLSYLTKYFVEVNSDLKDVNNRSLEKAVYYEFYTVLDTTDKFERISDEALLDSVQRRTFRYFWDFGHPVSGLSRERNTSGDLVTSGGSGFGVMTIPIGIERGYITRAEGLTRMSVMVDFLLNKAERYHGAFPHWLNGATGKTIPFSSKDDGADLVETSFLIAGLLTVRQYFNRADPVESKLRADINKIWEEVEWDWFTQGGKDVLYWHWSPTHGWAVNLPINGWNECLITYILAASSPTHAISPAVYHKGWAGNGSIVNNKISYGINLPLGRGSGGPLFFEHYTFLGIDPIGLKDQYADYEQQVKAHTLINRAYCIANPKNYYGYSAQCWGLTAGDIYSGYTASSPDNDVSVITPTAAISSIGYTYAESMEALRYFYYKLGDRLWGPMGFYDGFSLHKAWFATSTLAIDQGPILIMIENHRSGLLHDLLMNAPEVQAGMKGLGFTSPYF